MRHFYAELAAGQIAPVYLFFGDEPVLIDEALAALTKAVLPEADDWSREVFDGEQTTPAEIALAARAGNFFGGQRLLVVKGLPWLESAPRRKDGGEAKKNAAAKKAAEAEETAPLLAYIQDPNPETCLVLVMRGSPDKRRKLVQAIGKRGCLAEFSTPKGGEKEIWLANRFRQADKEADRAALHYISLATANLSQMAAEADKLCLYVGRRAQITLADAEAVVSKSSIFSVFELTDAAAAKNAPQAVAAYQHLLIQGEDLQKIFALLAGHFRNLLAVQDMLAQGQRSADLAGALGLHPFVAEKCSRQARAFSQAQLIKALEILLAADLAQKNGQGELQGLLETAILRICAF